MRREHVRVGQMRGVGIFVHWSVFLLLVVLAPAGVIFVALAPPSARVQWAIAGVATVVSYSSFILVHEIGHALAAQRRHCPVDWIEIQLAHGVTSYANPRSERDTVVIAWGGVLAQSVVALPAWIALRHWNTSLNIILESTLMMLGPVNVLVAVVNLVPIRGLDGATAWRILRRKRRWRPPTTALRGRG